MNNKLKQILIDHPNVYKFNESKIVKVYRYEDILFNIYSDDVRFSIIHSFRDGDAKIPDKNGIYHKEEKLSIDELELLISPNLYKDICSLIKYLRGK